MRHCALQCSFYSMQFEEQKLGHIFTTCIINDTYYFPFSHIVPNLGVITMFCDFYKRSNTVLYWYLQSKWRVTNNIISRSMSVKCKITSFRFLFTENILRKPPIFSILDSTFSRYIILNTYLTFFEN